MRVRTEKGQGTVMEYVLVFFLVVAVGMAMVVYVRRVVQGRMLDAARYSARMINSVYSEPEVSVSGRYASQYEPYYQDVETLRTADILQTRRTKGSLPKSSGIYEVEFADTMRTATNSRVLPPRNAR